MSAGQSHILHVFSTFRVAGVQVRFAAIANHYGHRYRHSIIAMDGDYGCLERLDPGLEVALPALRIRKGQTLVNIGDFVRLLRALQPDRLVTSNWGTIEWAMANKLVRVPHLHMEDGFGPEERDRQLPRRALLRRVFLRDATVLLPSRTLYGIALRQWRLPERSLAYVPNGIDLAAFDRAEPVAWPGEGPVIGSVGRISREKNLERLVLAYAAVRQAGQACRLVIVGEGAEEEALRRCLAGLAPEIRAGVTLAGHVAAPAGLYRSFDLVALSSDTEQMPMTVLEAMAAERPVVSTDVGDVRGMVAPENAAFVVPRDEAALAAALGRMLAAGEETWRALGRVNRAKAEREFDQAIMFRRHAELWAA